MEPLSIIAFTLSHLDKIKSIYQFTSEEIKHFLDDGLQKYIVNQKNKFEKIKTFLYKDDPVPFYDVYFPINLRGIEGGDNLYEINVDSNTKYIFSKSNYITVLGSAGSGKSMLTKHIFLHFLKYEKEIPIYIELRNMNHFQGTLYDYIIQNIFNNSLIPNDRILERLLKDGKFLFILDGYDEIYFEQTSKRKDELSQFIDRFSDNYYLISSREGTHIESFPRFYNLRVDTIKPNEIEDFVIKQMSKFENNSIWINNIMDVINDPNNKDYQDYMENPLLLTMFIFTFKDHPEFPHTKSKFYQNVFDTLCTKHDNFSKHGDIHKRKTNFKAEDFEEILMWFSFYTYQRGYFNMEDTQLKLSLDFVRSKTKKEFTNKDMVYDLTNSISILLKDGNDYKFPHRTLQEYFFTLLISKQNEQTKDKFYDLYIIHIPRYHFNVWRLSEELDIYFSNFLKAKLLELKGEISTNDINLNIRNLYKYLYISFSVHHNLYLNRDEYRLDHFINTDLLYVYVYKNGFSNVLSFYKTLFQNDNLQKAIEDYHLFRMHNLEEYYDPKSITIDNNTITIFIDYLISVGYELELKIIINDIDNTIAELNKRINSLQLSDLDF